MPKRSNLKPAGKCIFCLGGAAPGNPMTGEHLWSDWMQNAGLLQRISREYVQTGLNFRRHTAQRTVAQRYREGSPHFAKYRVVCKNCNSGWMSAIEEAAKPALILLMKGATATLPRDMRLKLTEWLVLKMLVVEHSQQPGYEPAPIYSQADREAFRASRKIPDHLRIYLGKHSSIPWRTGYHRHAGGLGFEKPLLPPPREPTGVRNVHAITWGIGSLLVYISGSTDSETERAVKFVKGPEFRRLWPLTANGLKWPPPIVMGGREIDDLARALGRFLDLRSR